MPNGPENRRKMEAVAHAVPVPLGSPAIAAETYQQKLAATLARRAALPTPPPDALPKVLAKKSRQPLPNNMTLGHGPRANYYNKPQTPIPPVNNDLVVDGSTVPAEVFKHSSATMTWMADGSPVTVAVSATGKWSQDDMLNALATAAMLEASIAVATVAGSNIILTPASGVTLTGGSIVYLEAYISASWTGGGTNQVTLTFEEGALYTGIVVVDGMSINAEPMPPMAILMDGTETFDQIIAKVAERINGQQTLGGAYKVSAIDVGSDIVVQVDGGTINDLFDGDPTIEFINANQLTYSGASVSATLQQGGKRLALSFGGGPLIGRSFFVMEDLSVNGHQFRSFVTVLNDGEITQGIALKVAALVSNMQDHTTGSVSLSAGVVQSQIFINIQSALTNPKFDQSPSVGMFSVAPVSFPAPPPPPPPAEEPEAPPASQWTTHAAAEEWLDQFTVITGIGAPLDWSPTATLAQKYAAAQQLWNDYTT